MGNWTISFDLVGNALDYSLTILEKDGSLEGAFESPRSGNTYACKSVTFKNRAVSIVIDRNFDGTEVTMTFEGKLADGELSGNLRIDGADGIEGGEWAAVGQDKKDS